MAALIVAAPLLGERPEAGWIRVLFAPLCHQKPDRSFHLAGAALPVCQRCAGIYAGLLIGGLAPASLLAAAGVRRRAVALAAAAPILIDAGLGLAGLWSGTPASRAATGLLFGTAAAALAMMGLTELDHARSTDLPFREHSNRTLEGVLHE
jgi:uncharacterized membrane protein